MKRIEAEFVGELPLNDPRIKLSKPAKVKPVKSVAKVSYSERLAVQRRILNRPLAPEWAGYGRGEGTVERYHEQARIEREMAKIREAGVLN